MLPLNREVKSERYRPLKKRRINRTYMLTPVVMTVHGKMTGRRRKKLEKRLGFGEPAVLEST